MLAVRAKDAVHAFRDDDAVLTRRFPEADGVVCSRNWRASEGPAPNDPLASRFQPTLDAARRDESYVSRGDSNGGRAVGHVVGRGIQTTGVDDGDLAGNPPDG